MVHLPLSEIQTVKLQKWRRNLFSLGRGQTVEKPVVVHWSLDLQLDLRDVSSRIHELVEIGSGTLRLSQMQPFGYQLGLQPSHPGDEVGVGGFHHQMIVIAHQAVRMHLPAGFQAGLAHGLEQVEPVHIGDEDVLAPISAAHDVIHRSGIFQANLSRHGQSVGAMPPLRQRESEDISTV
jgi:hypothetical protein